jgi:hypothetical protein
MVVGAALIPKASGLGKDKGARCTGVSGACMRMVGLGALGVLGTPAAMLASTGMDGGWGAGTQLPARGWPGYAGCG